MKIYPFYILTSSIFEPDGHDERPREGGHDGRHNPIRGPNNDPYKVKVSFAINNKYWLPTVMEGFKIF